MDKNRLSACEQEPLHLSGAILPHGTLLAVAPGGRVSHAAANLAQWLGQEPRDILGQPLPPALARLSEELPPQAGARITWEGAIQGAAGLLDLVATRNEAGQTVLELTTARPATDNRPMPAPSQLREPQDLDESRSTLMEHIADLTGFQRVMYYQFREDGDGEVTAEARRAATYGSYLGLRFPASDIPRIARALYLKNPWRLIPDARIDPVPVHGLDETPVDLTYSDLRSVSPIHRTYLANMGVRASLSFPLVMGENLTALVACHHAEPRRLSLDVLERASRLVRDHALAETTWQADRRMRLVDSLSHHFDHAISLPRRHGGLIAAWPELGPWLMQAFQADGATLCLGNACASVGVTLGPEELDALERDSQPRHREPIWTSDSLSRQVPGYPLSEVAGVMILRGFAGTHGELRLYLSRVEHIHEVAWGGNPEKPVEYHDGTLGIAPRRSFEKWLEKRLGYCRPWDNEARLLGLRLRELLLRESRA